MISLYSGTPGSGKSLHCARTIQNWSRLGYPVIGNFPVDLSKYKRADFTYCPNDQLSPDFLIQYSKQRFGSKAPKESSILLVIDECQLIFNAREWQQSGRAQWLSFFTQHRKLGYDIILIAQFDRMVDRQIRSLIEYEFIHRKMSNFGWQGQLLSLFFGGKTFIAVKMWYPLHERLGSELFHARKSLYSIYDSYATFDGDQNPAAPAAETPAGKTPGTDVVVSVNNELKLYKLPFMAHDLKHIKAKLSFAQKHSKNNTSVKVDNPMCTRLLSGDYERPYTRGTLVSFSGKYLRPGGRSETGWSRYEVGAHRAP